MRTDKYARRFRNRLPELRKLRDLTQTQLASRAGMQPAAISQFEAGVRVPNFESMVKLADALDMSADYIIGINEKPMSVGPTVDKLMRHAEQLPAYELDLLLNLAKLLAKKNKKRRHEDAEIQEETGSN